MREQELRRRMERHIGPLAEWWSRDVVLVALGNRTVREALDAGVPAQRVWRAVVDFLELPASER
ncbi:MAG: DUF3046 domain-containing protein [Nigerium sp.]|nr:DUF3046 domain-containing protein [Nigerium sp.]